MSSKPAHIRFWNGNKSAPRRRYEADLTQQLLSLIDPNMVLQVDHSDRLTAQAEADIFDEGFDLLVTVAGNPKFDAVQKRIISCPIAFGILGCRIPIYRRDQHARIHATTATPFKAATIALPADWADVPILQANGYRVATQPSLEACFEQVACGAVDYLCLGANEVQAIFEDFGKPFPELVIATGQVLYYPMPLQFYCHPKALVLQAQLTAALNEHQRAGGLLNLFEQHFGAQLYALDLAKREVHRLRNPFLGDGSSLAEMLSPLLGTAQLKDQNSVPGTK